MKTRPPKNGVKKKSKVRVLLVDGNALLKVAYNGAKDEYNRNGVHIGALFQFLMILRKRLNEDTFQQVYVFWDGKFSGKLRYEIYKNYKGDRGKDYINGNILEPELQNQQKLIQIYLSEFGIRQYQDPIIEGDDCVAYFVNNNQDKNITVMTNDRDMAQLIGENVRLYLLDRKEHLTVSNYSTLTGYTLKNALFVKIITGDDSDSVKGIKGLGITTLLKYFPEVKQQICDTTWFVKRAKELQEERLNNKKKPLKVFTNIIETNTDGIQGKALFRINEQIMSLKHPLLTTKSIENLDKVIDSPIDFESKSMKSVNRLLKEHHLTDLLRRWDLDEFLLPYKQLLNREKKLIIN